MSDTIYTVYAIFLTRSNLTVKATKESLTLLWDTGGQEAYADCLTSAGEFVYRYAVDKE